MVREYAGWLGREKGGKVIFSEIRFRQSSYYRGPHGSSVKGKKKGKRMSRRGKVSEGIGGERSF